MHKHHDGSPCGQGQHRHGFAHHHSHSGFGMGGHARGFAGHVARARRGGVRSAILRLLSETPMHGYQIIQELGTRSGGAWSPSAGSVYPTLQLLADEGLIIAEETEGKKVFSLTETGRKAVTDSADQPAPWEEAAAGDTGTAPYRDAVAKLMPVIFQIGKNGTAEQVSAAVEVINDTRKKLYSILAED